MAGSVLIRDFAGVNLAKAARDIEDNELAWAENVWSPSSSRLRLRPTTSVVKSYTTVLATYGTVPGHFDHVALAQLNDKYGFHHLFVWLPHYGDLPGATLFEWDGASASPVLSSAILTANDRPCFVNWRNRLYMFTGKDYSGYVFEPSAAGPLLGLSNWRGIGTWTPAVKPKVVGVYRNTFILAGMAPPYHDLLWPCTVDDPDTLLSSSKSFRCGPVSDDPYVAIQEVSVEGGSNALEPYCLVLKRNSMWMLQGDLPTSGGAGTIAVSPLSSEEGCCARETVTKTPYGVVWCSGKNVWLAPVGAKPIPIGNAIAERLKMVSDVTGPPWCGAFYDGHYRLSIPAAGKTPTGLSSSSILTSTEQWWLDMRKLPELRWYGPMTLPAAGMLNERLESGAERLVSVFTNQQPAQLDLYIAAEERGTDANQLKDAHTGLSGAPAPLVDIRTKEFDFGDPMTQKLVDYVEAELWQGHAANVSMKLYGEGGSYVKTPANVSKGGVGFVLGAGVLGTGVLSRKMECFPFYPPNGSRFIARTVQARVTSNTWTTDAGPDFELGALAIRTRPIKRRTSQ